MDQQSYSQYDQVFESNDYLLHMNEFVNTQFQSYDNKYLVDNTMDLVQSYQNQQNIVQVVRFQETSELKSIKSQETTKANSPEKPFENQEQLRKNIIIEDNQRCFRLFQSNSLTSIGTVLNLDILQPLSVVPIKKKGISKKKLKNETDNDQKGNNKEDKEGLNNQSQNIPLQQQFQCEKCLKSFKTSTGLGGHTSRKHPKSSEKYNKKIQTQKKNEVKRNRKVMILKVSMIN